MTSESFQLLAVITLQFWEKACLHCLQHHFREENNAREILIEHVDDRIFAELTWGGLEKKTTHYDDAKLRI